MKQASRERVVVLSGAGISAESGLKTFRGADGLWEGHRVEEVATPEAWARSPETVLRFYDERRRQLESVEPNAAHRSLAALEAAFEVSIVTQNVDNLHERGGSSEVLHLHGMLTQARSTADPSLIYDIGYEDIKVGSLCELGSQLRPNIVWFGEMVPMIEPAAAVVAAADVLIVVGTSLAVYPAAGLIHAAPPDCQRFLVDPEIPAVAESAGFVSIRKSAVEGVPELMDQLMENAGQ